MCIFKRKRPDPLSLPLPNYSDQTVVSLIVGNYPGTANDLAGPPNDQIDFEERVLSVWPNYVFRKFKDSESTINRLETELTNVVERMRPGDLLFFIMDNCFSESNTRGLNNPNILQARVYHNPEFPKHKKIIKRVISNTEGLNYISMSACLDHETAADAEFDGRANGAYHYCLIKTLRKGITYRHWDLLTLEELRKLNFPQTCTIEGPDELLDRKIFEGTVYCIEISSHGSHTYDENGDEPDQQDEGPYMFDGMILDDRISEILQRISVLT